MLPIISTLLENSYIVSLYLLSLILPLSPQSPSLGAQLAKNLPAVYKTHVWSLGWDYTLENKMTNHSSIHAWKIPWIEESGRLQSMRLQAWDTT